MRELPREMANQRLITDLPRDRSRPRSPAWSRRGNSAAPDNLKKNDIKMPSNAKPPKASRNHGLVNHEEGQDRQSRISRQTSRSDLIAGNHPCDLAPGRRGACWVAWPGGVFSTFDFASSTRPARIFSKISSRWRPTLRGAFTPIRTWFPFTRGP